MQEVSNEIDVKIKKYLRGEGANLEVWKWVLCPYIFFILIFFSLFFNLCYKYLVLNVSFQVLKDKKLKGQLAVREDLYGKSAKAAAKVEKVNSLTHDLLNYLFPS